MKNFINFIEDKGEVVDITDMPKLQQLLRLGLADANQIPLIKRTIQKMDAGEELNVKERKIAQDLAKKLIDMVVGNKTMFSLARQGLQKEDNEIV